MCNSFCGGEKNSQIILLRAKFQVTGKKIYQQDMDLLQVSNLANGPSIELIQWLQLEYLIAETRSDDYHATST